MGWIMTIKEEAIAAYDRRWLPEYQAPIGPF
jgi:hypothetical protein